MKFGMETIEAIGAVVIGLAQILAMILLGSCGHIGDVCHIPGWSAWMFLAAPLVLMLWVVMIPSDRGLRGWWKRRQMRS